jgi:hypothetical protein
VASDDFLYLDVLGDRNLLRNLDQMPDVVRAVLLDKVERWTATLKDDVRENIASKLKEQSGKLAAGLDSEVYEEGKRVVGRVFIAGVPYARPQEEGATVGPHMIYPRKGKVLAFYGATGQKIFATKVSHPGGHIPAAHFMKDAYREHGAEISRGIKNAVVQGLRAKMRQSA